MQKVAIIGSGGSGKSELARRLGAILGLEVHHLDALNWKPGWVATPKPEWRALVEELAGRDRWIIDGNYGGTLDVRLAAADAIVFLDLPRTICLWRAVKRGVRYRRRLRPDIAPGCPERFDRQFLEYLRWIWGYPSTRRPSVLQRIERLGSGAQVHILRSRRDVEVFVSDIERGAGLSMPSDAASGHPG